MDIIPIYESARPGFPDALAGLESFAQGRRSVLCRVRKTLDNVLIVYPDPSLYRRCGEDKRVEMLFLREVQALMNLNGYPVLKFEDLLSYKGDAEIIVHFRNYRPPAWILNRMRDCPKLRIATDSAEQFANFIDGCPYLDPVGVACHVPTAKRMMEAGARRLVFWGRSPDEYAPETFVPLASGKMKLYAELSVYADDSRTALTAAAERLGLEGFAVPLESAEKLTVDGLK